MGQHKKHEKEVANKMATSQKIREESFGSAPEDIDMSKGAKFMNFGYKIRGASEIWPKGNTSVDQKSGFPENRN